MTHRERILAVFRGEKPDRLPWAPRLKLWHNARIVTDTVPARFRGMSLLEIHRELGLGFRGVAPVVKGREFGFERRADTLGEDTVTRLVTPHGTLRIVDSLTEAMRVTGVVSAYRREHPLKSLADYDAMEYVLEHTRPEESYQEYARVAEEIGEDGLVFGTNVKCPFQHWIVDLAGYETAFAHLMDFPDRVERFLRFLTDWTLRSCRVMAHSPAPVILCSDNFSGIITHGKLFRRFCLPFLQTFSTELHQRGKYLASHLDGEPKPLLQVFPESGVDVAECFTPAPMTQVTLRQAQEAWGIRVRIWGGIPSILLSSSTSEDDFRAAMDDLFSVELNTGRLILGVGDNVTADGLIERVEYITNLVEANDAGRRG